MSVVANVAINVDSRDASAKLRQFQQQSSAAAKAAQDLQKTTDATGAAATKAGRQYQTAANGMRYFIDATGRARKENGQFVTTAEAAAAGLEKQSKAAGKAAGALRGLGGIIASIGAGALVAGMVRGAAAAEQLQLRLKLLSGEYGETARIQQFVTQSAKTFGQSQIEAAGGVADVYARLRPLGVSLDQIETIYKGFNATALASGTSAEAASSAFLQLSQALGSGTLQGDEFRSVAEQVPGILRLVAGEMNVTVGELKKLGSEGKITSDILINALAKGFEENSSKVKQLLDQSPAQRFKEFQNATQQLSNSIGSELLPVVTPFVQGATELLRLFGQLPGPVKAFAATFVGLTAAIQAASAAKAFFLSLSGVGMVKVAGAAFAAATAYAGLKAIIDRTKTGTDEASAATSKADAGYKQLTKTAEQLKKEFKSGSEEIKHQTQLLSQNFAAERQRINSVASLVQARSQAEIAVNNVILQRLEYELQSAKTQEERMRIAREIYNVEVANARATYQANIARIQAQTQLVELAVKEQEQKRLMLEIEKALALQKDQDVTQLERAIALQSQAARLAADNLSFTRQIAAEQLRGADATYRAAVQAAALKAETSGAAQAAAQFAGSMQQAATAAAAVAAVLPKEPRTLAGLDPAQGPRFGTTADGMPVGQAMAAQRAQAKAEILGSGYGVGRNEMRAAIGRYTPATTETANVNPQVNITTGPVMQMDGTNYVTQRDLMSATQSAARQGANMALGSLRSDPATRRSLGLAR